MERISGFKIIKNNSGKITHVTLSMRHHSELLQDMIDINEMSKARKGDTVDWTDARKIINKKHHLKD